MAFVGGVLWGPAAHFPLITRAIWSRGTPCVGCVNPSVVVGLTTVGVLVGGTGLWPGWLPGPASCSICWLVAGKVESQGVPGGPDAGVGLLVGDSGS